LGDDHGEERGGVDREAGTGPPPREDDAGDHGADRARQVELQRVQGHRVRNLLRRHQGREHRLVGGRGLRLGQAGEERDQQDRHDPEAAERVEDAEGGREQHLQDLRREQDPPAVHAVGHRSAHEHERDERRIGGEGAQPEVERVHEADVDEPRQRDVLGPRADAAQERAGPEQAEVAIREAAQEARKGEAPGARIRHTPDFM
jgi:hypothetical protein